MFSFWPRHASGGQSPASHCGSTISIPLQSTCGFVVDRLAMGQAFCSVPTFLLVSIIPSILHLPSRIFRWPIYAWQLTASLNKNREKSVLLLSAHLCLYLLSGVFSSVFVSLFTHTMPAPLPVYLILLHLVTLTMFDGHNVARKIIRLLNFKFLRCVDINVMPSPMWQTFRETVSVLRPKDMRLLSNM
jgi:hypothetical protein